MPGTRISTGSTWEHRAGDARAVVLPDPGGDWILVSGTTGYDYATGEISADPVAQARQCFANIRGALEQAGAGLADLVRIRVIVTSQSVFDAVIDVIGEHCQPRAPPHHHHRGLVAPEMVEIEVTARKRPCEAEPGAPAALPPTPCPRGPMIHTCTPMTAMGTAARSCSSCLARRAGLIAPAVPCPRCRP